MANPIAPLNDPLSQDLVPILPTALPPSGLQAAWIPKQQAGSDPIYVPIDASESTSYSRTLGIEANFNTIFVVGRIADYPSIYNLNFDTTKPVSSTNPQYVPMFRPENIGTLVLSDGIGHTVVFHNQTIHEVADTLDINGGQVIRISIKDKRYILNRGALFGSWNTPKPGQEFDEAGLPIALTPLERIVTKLRRTLKQLIIDCFEEMGLDYDVDPNDRAFDVEELTYKTEDDLKELDPDLAEPDPDNPAHYVTIKKPNPNYDPDIPGSQEFVNVVVGDDIQIYPVVNWEGDTPGRELQRLLDDYGFAVSLWGDYNEIQTPTPGETPRRMVGKLVVVKLGRPHPYQLNGYIAPTGTNFDHQEARHTSTNQAKDAVVLGDRIVIQTELVNQERRLENGTTEVIEHYGLPIGLEPVGLDLDGEIKPLSELSYAVGVVISDPPDPAQDQPFGRFTMVGLSDVSDVFADVAEFPDTGVIQVPPNDPDVPGVPAPGSVEYAAKLLRIQKLAASCIWKWYQLPRSSLWRLPLLPEIVQAHRVGLTSKRAAPIVKIKTLSDFDLGSDNETLFRVVEQGYTIDENRGVVKFEKSQVRTSSTTGLDPLPGWPHGVTVHAHVSLTFAFRSVSVIKDEDDEHDQTKWLPQVHLRDYYHYPKAYQDEGQSAAPADIKQADIIRRPEMVLYRIEPFSLVGAVDDTNKKELDQFARRLLREHNINTARILYAPEGNIPVIVDKLSTDGMFRQIVWTVSGGQGAETSLVVNREKARGNTAVMEYRMRDLMNRLLLKHNRFDAHNLKIDQPVANTVVERESPRKARSRPGTVAIRNKNEEVSPLARNDEDDESIIPAFSFVELSTPGPDGALGVLPVQKPMLSTVNPRYLATDATLVRESSAFAAREGLVYVRLDPDDTTPPVVGDYVSPGLAEGQDPYRAYRGSHFRVFDILPIDEENNRPDPMALIEMPTIFDTAFRAVVLEVKDTETTGHHWLRCRKIIQQPDVYDPDAPDILADAGFWSWFQEGDRVALLRVATVPGDPANQPSYFAFFNPPIDQTTKIEPHTDCQVRATNSCPPPAPDPNPCAPPVQQV